MLDGDGGIRAKGYHSTELLYLPRDRAERAVLISMHPRKTHTNGRSEVSESWLPIHPLLRLVCPVLGEFKPVLF